MTEADFLRAIIAAPSDDAPRLALADWLEENGQEERGEFVRLQVQLAKPGWDACACFPSRWPNHKYVCQSCNLKERMKALLFEHAIAWSKTGLSDANTVVFRRGFVHAIRCLLADWLAHGPAIVRQQPVQEVVISDREPIDDERSNFWYWWNQTANITRIVQGDLPTEVYFHLNDYVDCFHGRWKAYPTEAAARDALSAACLAWAKNKSLVPT